MFEGGREVQISIVIYAEHIFVCLAGASFLEQLAKADDGADVVWYVGCEESRDQPLLGLNANHSSCAVLAFSAVGEHERYGFDGPNGLEHVFVWRGVVVCT